VTEDEPLRAIAPELWVADRPLPLIVGDVGARMTVARLPGGELWVHSPIAPDDATRACVDALGPVRFLVAPCLHHHFFVRAWTEAYPEAALYGPPRLPRKKKGLPFAATIDGSSPTPWESTISTHLFGGAPGLDELVFLHRPTRTLILTDLCFNVTPGGRDEARLFHRLVGAHRGFGPHRIVRASIRDRAAARASVETLLGWDFDRIVVAHGEVLETGGHEAFAKAFAYL